MTSENGTKWNRIGEFINPNDDTLSLYDILQQDTRFRFHPRGNNL